MSDALPNGETNRQPVCHCWCKRGPAACFVCHNNCTHIPECNVCLILRRLLIPLEDLQEEESENPVKGEPSPLLYRTWWETARTPPLLGSSENTILGEEETRRGKKTEKKSKTQEEKERTTQTVAAGGPAALCIRLSMNLINMTSLISSRKCSTEGHPLCSTASFLTAWVLQCINPPLISPFLPHLKGLN